MAALCVFAFFFSLNENNVKQEFGVFGASAVGSFDSYVKTPESWTKSQALLPAGPGGFWKALPYPWAPLSLPGADITRAARGELWLRGQRPECEQCGAWPLPAATAQITHLCPGGGGGDVWAGAVRSCQSGDLGSPGFSFSKERAH